MGGNWFSPEGCRFRFSSLSLPRFMKPVANKVQKASLRFDGSYVDVASSNIQRPKKWLVCGLVKLHPAVP